jgi:hypothetical protein
MSTASELAEEFLSEHSQLLKEMNSQQSARYAYIKGFAAAIEEAKKLEQEFETEYNIYSVIFFHDLVALNEE